MSSKRRPPSSAGAEAPAPKSAKNTDSEYQRGSITRIKMKNFVTYVDTEFRPGPNLNVVIGPNGTGKSSIVCALCIGLGGSASILGRSKNEVDYIRSGDNEATVEIELHNGVGEATTVIRRTIRKALTGDGANSTWHMDGKKATEKAVKAKISSYNIQVSNVCQFLPQDKVAELAKKNPADLLVATEQAVGGNEMVAHHDTLKRLGKTALEFEQNLEKAESHIEQLKAQNALLHPEVERFRERQRQAARLNVIQQKIPWVKYEVARTRYVELKEKLVAKKVEVEQLERQSGPTEDALQKARDQEKAARDSAAAQNRDAAMLDTEKRKMDRKLNKHEETAQELAQELKQAGKDVKKYEKGLAAFEEKMASLEGRLAACHDESVFRPEMERIRQAKGQLNAQLSDEAAALQKIQPQLRKQTAMQQRVLKDISGMQDEAKRRLQKLKQEDSETAAAVLWLREHQDMFSKPIAEPLCLTMNVQNKDMAKFVEACVPNKDWTSFVAQTKSDMKNFIDNVSVQQKLRVNCVLAEAGKDPSSPPIGNLRQYGFHTYVKDLFTAPAPVVRYLCRTSRVHEVPVGSAETDKLSEDIVNDPSCGFSKFFSPQSVYSVMVSRYDKQAKGTRVTTIRSPRYLTDSVDNDRLTALKQQQRDLTREVEQLGNQKMIHETQMKALRTEISECESQLKDLKTKKNERSTIQSLIKRENTNRDNNKRALEDARNRLDHAGQRSATVDAKRAELHEKIVAVMARMTQAVSRTLRLKVDALQAQRVVGLRDREHQEATKHLKEMKHQLADMKHDVDRSKNEARSLMNEAKKASGVDRPTEEMDIAFKQLPGNLHDLVQSLYEEQAKMDCNVDVDEELVRQYMARKEEISQQEAELTAETARREELVNKIEEVKGQWLPPLRAIIGKISDSFSSYFRELGCAGEVHLYEAEEFDKYGVEIRVKFREGDKLQQLTEHHQSGGERAVSTMLYLMALQEQTTCPFRVVDEINQGMDPENERDVFKQVLRCSSAEDTSQYFLATPKLLPNLQYNEKIRVLCVYNGHHMVAHTQWNASRFIRARRALVAK